MRGFGFRLQGEWRKGSGNNQIFFSFFLIIFLRVNYYFNKSGPRLKSRHHLTKELTEN